MDIRMKEIKIEVAKEFVDRLQDEWIYIKYTCDLFNNDESEQIAFYSKFKVVFTSTKYEKIEIYGEEKDRLVIDYSCIVSTEMTSTRDELLLCVKKSNVLTNIYIKKYLPQVKNRLNEIVEAEKNLIITEGKTDWKHLKHALKNFQERGLYSNINFSFFEYEDIEMGADTLMRVCEYNKLFHSPFYKIFIFDSDRDDINKIHNGKAYVDHGNNVFSLVIPVPESSKNTPLISIENYYMNDELKISDSNGYRLYFNEEFNHNTGELLENNNIYDKDYEKHKKMGDNYIIDYGIYYVQDNTKIDKKHTHWIIKNCKNIALSKNNFAVNILNSIPPFDKISCNNFYLIFDVIEKIIQTGSLKEYNGIQDRIISKKEISSGIVINEFINGFKTLEISILAPSFLNIEDGIEYCLTSIYFDGKQIFIEIGIQNDIIKLPLPFNNKIVSFFQDKCLNHYNRIELFVYDNDIVKVVELLSGEFSSTLIERLLDSINGC